MTVGDTLGKPALQIELRRGAAEERQEGFIAQKPRDGAEILTTRTSFGMTGRFVELGCREEVIYFVE